MELASGFAYHAVDAPFADDAPAVRTVDEIFASAIAARASDLHLEPFEHGGGRVRERIDGVLREARRIADPLFLRAVSRIKLLAGMDIADRRLPQDGRYAIARHDGSVDARVSSMPTIHGEKLAIRLLDTTVLVPRLDALGMPAPMLRRYRELVHGRSGFVVVCGPTGSGKTTTLYATLAERNGDGQHLCTIEDPVEAGVPGVMQVQVNARAGLTFSAALRAFLRQDPDVIMIGEMRDPETATTAISAALSGQMVFTTLHSHDALRAIERLTELGIASRQLATAVSVIVAQRLLRRLCSECKRLSGTGTYESVGCHRCSGSGYRGRVAVFEMVCVGETLQDAIATNLPLPALRARANETGYEPLSIRAMDAVRRGETDEEEVRRVAGW
jgi:type II secretory ATPase GspE/PulE/Tfp pilus assembly ATPase PilB-like protein